MSLTTKEQEVLNQRNANIAKAVKAGALDKARELVTQQAAQVDEISKSAVSAPEGSETDPAVFEAIWKSLNPGNDEAAEFQKACDDVYMTASILGYIKHNDRTGIVTAAPEVMLMKSHRALRARFPRMYAMAKSAAARAMLEARQSPEPEAIAKAMYSTGTAVGDEWVPSHHSPRLAELVRLEAKIAGLFNEIRMPTDPFTIPVQGALPNVVILNEETSNTPTAITKGNVATASSQLVTKKYGLAVPFSVELTEDSIIPVVSLIRSELAQVAAHDWDYTILNGDTTNPHQDSDVDTATHRGRGLIGLRKMIQAAASIDGATFDLERLRTMRANMAKHGVAPSKLAFITSVAGYMRMLGLAEVVSLDKFGPNATVFNGQLGSLDGIPVIVSEECRQDLNASGVYDATTTTNTLIVCANRSDFLVGTRREPTVKLWVDPRYDQDQLILTYRKDFKNTISYTANNIVGEVYGIANAG